jgi:hypothetical protein
MSIRPIIEVVIGILVVGVFVWAVDSLPGIDPTFKQVARIILIAALILWVIFVIAGMFGYQPLKS